MDRLAAARVRRAALRHRDTCKQRNTDHRNHIVAQILNGNLKPGERLQIGWAEDKKPIWHITRGEKDEISMPVIVEMTQNGLFDSQFDVRRSDADVFYACFCDRFRTRVFAVCAGEHGLGVPTRVGAHAVAV